MDVQTAKTSNYNGFVNIRRPNVQKAQAKVNVQTAKTSNYKGFLNIRKPNV